MATVEDILVPDIGDFAEVEVIEILVKPGDRIEAEQSLLTLESDKATMEIPAPRAGVVKEIKVKLGDKIAAGDLILTLEGDAAPASGGTDTRSSGHGPASGPASASANPGPGTRGNTARGQRRRQTPSRSSSRTWATSTTSR